MKISKWVRILLIELVISAGIVFIGLQLERYVAGNRLGWDEMRWHMEQIEAEFALIPPLPAATLTFYDAFYDAPESYLALSAHYEVEVSFAEILQYYDHQLQGLAWQFRGLGSFNNACYVKGEYEFHLQYNQRGNTTPTYGIFISRGVCNAPAVGTYGFDGSLTRSVRWFERGILLIGFLEILIVLALLVGGTGLWKWRRARRVSQFSEQEPNLLWLFWFGVALALLMVRLGQPAGPFVLERMKALKHLRTVLEDLPPAPGATLQQSHAKLFNMQGLGSRFLEVQATYTTAPSFANLFQHYEYELAERGWQYYNSVRSNTLCYSMDGYRTYIQDNRDGSYTVSMYLGECSMNLYADDGVLTQTARSIEREFNTIGLIEIAIVLGIVVAIGAFWIMKG